MFGRWSRKHEQRLPDLDSEVTAHWNRGRAPSNAPPSQESLDDNLNFAPASYRVGKMKECSRTRRRLLVSLCIGLILGPIVVGAAFYLMRYINPVIRATETLGERMTFGPHDEEEIYYTRDIEPDQVRHLGAFLQHKGVFDGRSAKSVRLSTNGDVLVVGFAVVWNSWENPEVVNYFRELQGTLSEGAFHGRPVEIHLCARQADSQGRLMPAMYEIQANPKK
jgi:hypothetical protein